MRIVNYDDMRRTSQEVVLKFKIFSVNDIPTCSSWVGSRDHPPETCPFLYSTNYGSKFLCTFINKKLDIDSKTGLILPNKNCPLWDKHNESSKI